MKRSINLEVVYPHPPERVWKALTDSNAIGEWLMPNNFRPELGHKFQFKTRPRPGFNGIIDCEVIEIDEPHQLSYTWVGGSLETVVTFTLQAVAEGTKLTMAHTGFTGAKGLMALTVMSGGWKKKIMRLGLPAVLDRLRDGSFQPD